MPDKMLKFVKIGQQTPPKREIDTRKKDFNEIYDEYINENFDFIITVCDNAKETCPVLPMSNAKKIHKNFKDPSKSHNGNYGKDFIEVRGQIKKFIIDFIKTELI